MEPPIRLAALLRRDPRSPGGAPLALPLLLCACASGGASPPDLLAIDLPAIDAAKEGPQVGDVERVATLPARTEGIAFGEDAAGRAVLYVGSAGALWRIREDGATTKVADVPSPVGIAVRADGDVLVCGQGEGDIASAVIWRVTPSGSRSVLVRPPEGQRFQLTNFVAVAPDDRLVFSDSDADRLYMAEPDGSGVRLITDQISFPNGLAFTADGQSLLVAAWDAKTVYRLKRLADGYGAPAVHASVAFVDGLTTLASGALLFVTSGGVFRMDPDQPPRLVSRVAGTLPANGASGRGAYGEGWLYLSNLFGGDVYRLYLGEAGVPLPAR